MKERYMKKGFLIGITLAGLLVTGTASASTTPLFTAPSTPIYYAPSTPQDDPAPKTPLDGSVTEKPNPTKTSNESRSIFGIYKTYFPSVAYSQDFTDYTVVHSSVGAIDGGLEINPNGTYTWNTYKGLIKGTWVNTDDKTYRIVLQKALDGVDWSVAFKDDEGTRIAIWGNNVWLYGDLIKALASDEQNTSKTTDYQTTNENAIVLHVGNPNATVKGQKKAMDASPLIENGRTLVPVRFIAENLGAQVEWIENYKGQQALGISVGQKVIVLVIGINRGVVGENVIELDAAPNIHNGRTYVPLRFVSEQLGSNVTYNPSTQEIVLMPK